MSKVLLSLPVEPSTGIPKLSDDELSEKLSLLPPDINIAFLEGSTSDGKDSYFPLDSAGIVFLDLDFDGDEDMVYSGPAGVNGLRDTKVFFKEGHTLKLYGTLRGRLLQINQHKKTTTLSTLWQPCCDSYTSRIEKHAVAVHHQVDFVESISIIGRIESIFVDPEDGPQVLKGVPDFSSLKQGHIKNTSLYASRVDFRGTSPYFRERNKEVREILRKVEEVALLSIKEKVAVLVLDEKVVGNKQWWLVLTAPLQGVPKSLYEWSNGDNRRFIGWVDSITLE
ncbi:MAG: hypothetical protein AAFX87_29255 [Bacteroidota bacterium]